jgi:hypothetical protein
MPSNCPYIKQQAIKKYLTDTNRICRHEAQRQDTRKICTERTANAVYSMSVNGRNFKHANSALHSKYLPLCVSDYMCLR